MRLLLLLLFPTFLFGSATAYIEAGTDFPASFALKGGVVINKHILIEGSVGYMPDSYASVINETIIALGGYSDETGTLIKNSLKESFVFELKGGYLFKNLFITSGLQLITLGGDMSSAELLQSVTRITLPMVVVDSELPVSSTLLNLSLQAGYRYHLPGKFKNLTITSAIGLVKTIYSHTEVDFPLTNAATDTFNNGFNEYMDDIYIKYSISPVVSLYIGYQF